jgi:putative oxygen-independent coproporphyrinogen III oxidase
VPASPDDRTNAFGVYVHVPFCASRCGYCDFATWTDRDHLIGSYVDACVTDLGRHREQSDVPEATSVFFGGGTPSLLPFEQLTRILDAIPRATDAEVTVECNPDSVDPEKLARYRDAGVNRVSFGVQSLRPHVLAALDRTHEPANVELAVQWARDAGFETFNLDLIYGTPGESDDDWLATLEGVLAFDPPHISAYALTVEPGTPLGRQVADGAAPAPDDDDQASKHAVADDRLRRAGLEWYEVSIWARPGHECRHNLLYWSQGEYLPVGCAAHGHRAGRRWWTMRTPERYIDAVIAGTDPVAGDEMLDQPARLEERFALSLRTREGAVVPPAAQAEADRLVAGGFLEEVAGRVVMTQTGRMLGTDLTARLLAAFAETPAGTR